MQKSNIINGLSQAEADRILKKDGFNELPSQKRQSGFLLLVKVLSEPMLLLLIVAGFIYLLLGEPRDAIVLMFSVVVVIIITFYQERKTEKTLEALRDLSSPRALVVRDGEHKRIVGREVVRGDIIIIREGDRVPADAVLLSCENLSADESLLTGESMPVRKAEGNEETAFQRPGGDGLPFIYSGSLITNGRGTARVISTGLNTEIGTIGKSLENIKDEDTLLRKETTRIVQVVAIIGLFLCILVVAFYAVAKGDIVTGFLSGITLAMAILPEEFPVVLVIFLTLGAWRISKKRVLTRRSATIETLGGATVLCTDKTGTLTMNKMELNGLRAGNSMYELDSASNIALPDSYKELLEFGVLASQKDPFDPIEKELNRVGQKHLDGFDKKYAHLNLVKEYPLSKNMLALSHVWQSRDKTELTIASKGAPEAIIDLCHFDEGHKEKILNQVEEMSDRGMRVLGVAKATFKGTNLPDNQHDFKFHFVGLLGFIDPIRASTPRAIQEVYDAGMRVIMITGDYPGTAQYVARKIGIKNPEVFLIGDDLRNMSQVELKEKIRSINIFARIVPEQKLFIVEALKANEEIVAMTGDGVNDAPALKSAHIGIAMGERGTDVAREASALVLLNDDFSSIVDAVRLGRRIYDNLKQAMGYLLAVHVPIAGMSVLPLFFNMPIVLFPAHIAFMEFIIDPTCSIVFESKKAHHRIMKRPPRNLHQPMFDLKTVLINLAQGIGVLVATFVLFVFVTKMGRSEFEARSFAFASLVIGNLGLILVNLSWSENIFRTIISANRILLAVCIGAALALVAVLYVPFFAGIFHLAPLDIGDIALIVVVVFSSLVWFEVVKLIKNKGQLVSN